MKTKIHFLIALLSLPLVLTAQNVDDDMYFVPNKKTIKVEKAKSNTKEDRKTYSTVVSASNNNAEVSDIPEAEYYTGELRDVDEYNRRNVDDSQVKARISNDTLYIVTESELEEEANSFAHHDRHGYYSDDCYYDDDFYYSSRLIRYHGRHFYDPFMWDYCYGWYDPWYDPWYGFYGPYYRYGYYSWYNWGWGWHHRPGWIWGWGCGSPIYHPHHPPHHGHKPGIGHGGGGHRFGTGRHDFVNRGNSNGIHNGNRVIPARTKGVPNSTSRGLRGTLTRDNRNDLRQNSTSSGRNTSSSVNRRGTSSRNTTAARSSTSTNTRNSSTINSSRSTTSRSSSSSYVSPRSSSSSSFGGGSRGGGGLSGGGSRSGGGGRGGR